MSNHVHKFAKPYKFEDSEHTEIDLNLDGLTGRDLSEAKKEFSKDNPLAFMMTTDYDFHIAIAVKTTGKPIEFFNNMPAQDAAKISMVIMGFLNS